MYKKHTINLGKGAVKPTENSSLGIEATEEEAWKIANDYILEAGRSNNLPLYERGSKIFCEYNLFKDSKEKASLNDEYMEKVKELKTALRIYAKDDEEWGYVLANLKKPDYDGILKAMSSARWVSKKLRNEKYGSDEDNQKKIFDVIDDLTVKMANCTLVVDNYKRGKK